jgi:hypothetical protein
MDALTRENKSRDYPTDIGYPELIYLDHNPKADSDRTKTTKRGGGFSERPNPINQPNCGRILNPKPPTPEAHIAGPIARRWDRNHNRLWSQ